MLEEEEKRFDASPLANKKQSTESSEEAGNLTFADLMGDTDKSDVPTMDDLIGDLGGANSQKDA